MINQTYEINNQNFNNLKTFDDEINKKNDSYKIPNYYNSEQNNINFYSVKEEEKTDINLNNKNNDSNLEKIGIEIPEKCLRCKSSKPTVLCKECYPFVYFCDNCDNHIHNIPTKKNHNRLSLNPVDYQQHNQNFFNNQTNSNFSNQNFNLSTINNPTINNSNNNNNKISSNYINEIKSIYDKEKENLLKKTFDLEKELETTKNVLNSRIDELHVNLENLSKSKEIEIEDLKKKYEFQIKKLEEDKNLQISNLLNQNEKLSNLNENLIKKYENLNNLSSNNIKENKINNDNLKFEIEKLKKEKNDLIKYYEKKMSYFNNNYFEDKSSIINSYEDQINKIKADYDDKKTKFSNLLNQREKDVGIIIDEYRDEYDKMKNELENLKMKTNYKEKEYQDLYLKVKEQKYNIEVLNGEIDKLNKKVTELLNDKKNLEKENNLLIKDNETLNLNINKLHKITHGKFKNLNLSQSLNLSKFSKIKI